MARFASAVKAGFYATPPEEVSQICSRLRINQGDTANILDPCAGEGVALSMMADALKKQGGKVESYGIELEKTRAEKCRRLLDKVIHSPYEDACVTSDCFSFLWLNPPYDDYEGERSEVAFLRRLTDGVSGKLQPGGLLGYCIPGYVLRKAATLLAVRFDGIRVYRFTDRNYPDYGQVVVFGYRRERPNTRAKEIAELLKAIAETPELLPELDAPDGITFHVPPSEREVQTFKGVHLSPAEVRECLEQSPIWTEVAELTHVQRKQILKPPVLPLKNTHIAVAIAAGAIKENMGDHLLVGKTVKYQEKETVHQEDGAALEIERDCFKTAVMIYTRDGVFEIK